MSLDTTFHLLQENIKHYSRTTLSSAVAGAVPTKVLFKCPPERLFFELDKFLSEPKNLEVKDGDKNNVIPKAWVIFIILYCHEKTIKTPLTIRSSFEKCTDWLAESVSVVA